MKKFLLLCTFTAVFSAYAQEELSEAEQKKIEEAAAAELEKTNAAEVAPIVPPPPAPNKAVLEMRAIVERAIEIEHAEMTVRHALNVGATDIPHRDFYTKYIASYIDATLFATGPQGSNTWNILTGATEMLSPYVDTDNQRMTLSAYGVKLANGVVNSTGGILTYPSEKTIKTPVYGKVSKRTGKAPILRYTYTKEKIEAPAIFQATTGAKVVKTLPRTGERIVAYTQPGVYTPLMSSAAKESEEFEAKLYDYVYFNRGDALHRTVHAESELGSLSIIGTMQASGGCTRLSAFAANFTRKKLEKIKLPHARVQVVESDDNLRCVSEGKVTHTLFLSKDRTSGHLVKFNAEQKPETALVFVRGETDWRVGSSGRFIILSTLPKLVLDENPDDDTSVTVEVTYLTLTDQATTKGIKLKLVGRDYKATLKTQRFVIDHNSKKRAKFNFKELSSFIKTKADQPQDSYTCQKI